MRQGQNPRRSRNNRRNNSGSRTIDSNGPEVKVRGTATQLFDKYQTLARESVAASDRVAAENYYQHAEHYYRLLNASQNDAGQRNEAGNKRQGGQDQQRRDHQPAPQAGLQPAPEAAPQPTTGPAPQETPQEAPQAAPESTPAGFNGGETVAQEASLRPDAEVESLGIANPDGHIRVFEAASSIANSDSSSDSGGEEDKPARPARKKRSVSAKPPARGRRRSTSKPAGDGAADPGGSTPESADA